MSEDSLEQLRLKVERGEALSADELVRLQKEAQLRGGPGLRLALAHAFLNADQAVKALPVLEALHREHPEDVQAALALARAFVALERYEDAEKALDLALRDNPADVETMKAIVVLALRRGALEKARRLVQDVLRVDGLDEEAHALRRELAALGDAAEARSPNADARVFSRLLGRRLREMGVSYTQHEDELGIQLAPSRVMHVDLGALYTAYCEEPIALELAVEAIAKELAELSSGLPKTKDALLTAALPVLRRVDFGAKDTLAAWREGPAGLGIFYTLDNPELVRYVPSTLLAEMGVTLAELDARAFENLEGRPPLPRSIRIQDRHPRVFHEETGLWGLCEGDGHDAARLLTTARERLRKSLGSGQLRVAMGSKEWVVVCREDNLEAVRLLETLEVSSEGIPGAFRLTASDVLEVMASAPARKP